MAYCRFFVTVDWNETTKINAVNYDFAEKIANSELQTHFQTTGEKSKVYIFQDNIQIATIHFGK